MNTISREATSELVALPESSPETLETSEVDCSDSTSVECVSYAFMVDSLSANDLDALAALYHDRATRQRKEIEFDEASALVKASWLTPQAETSPMAEILRVKNCLKRLIARGTYHEEQVRGVFTIIAFNTSGSGLIAVACVNRALAEGLAERKAALNGE